MMMSLHKNNDRLIRVLLCVMLFVLFPSPCQARGQKERDDVPLHKAPKPRMDPIPMLPSVTHKVFLDITIGTGNHNNDLTQHQTGRIVLGLFGEHAPKMVENFHALCACNKGLSRVFKKPLCYKGSIFHRAIPNFMIQGGDITHSDGTGGESIYGSDIEDESFAVKHNRKYLLSSANRGRRHSNGSQFFITTVKAQWLDGHHVVFGVVLEGEDVVQAIEKEGTNGGRPKKVITITESGVLEMTEKDRKPIRVTRMEDPVLLPYREEVQPLNASSSATDAPSE